MPQIEINTGFGFRRIPSYQELIVNTIDGTVKTAISNRSNQLNEYAENFYIYMDRKKIEGDKIVFDLEFDLKSDRNPEMVAIDNQRDDVFKELFKPNGVHPIEIIDVTNNVMPNEENDRLIGNLSRSGISPARWQYHYLLSLIYHFADNSQATESYKQAKTLGYKPQYYNEWPQIPSRDSDENIVLSRIKLIIDNTRAIPEEYFLQEQTNLSKPVNEKLEAADDLILKVQEIGNWMKYVKNNRDAPNMDVDLFIAQVDLAIGLGDLALADDYMKGLSINNKERTARRDLRPVHKKIKKDNHYLIMIKKREEKIKSEVKYQQLNKAEIADYNSKIFLEEKKNPYKISFNDQTGDEIKFRILSSNDLGYHYNEKGKKLRSNVSSATFYGQGIYTIDPEAEKDEKNIKKLNLIFFFVAIGLLVLI